MLVPTDGLLDPRMKIDHIWKNERGKTLDISLEGLKRSSWYLLVKLRVIYSMVGPFGDAHDELAIKSKYSPSLPSVLLWGLKRS